MRQEVYEAMKTRLEVREIRLGVHYVTFKASDPELNKGYGCFEHGWIDYIGERFEGKKFNLWNVAQHFHSILKWWADDLDERLVANPWPKK